EGPAGEANNLRPLGVPLQISAFAQTEFAITADPKMPDVPAMASIVGVSPDPTATTAFYWTAVIQYDASGSPHGPSNRPIVRYTTTQTVAGGTFHPQFTVIRGGDLTFTAEADVAGLHFTAEADGLTIVGTNPQASDVDTWIELVCKNQGLVGDKLIKAIA